MTLSIKARCSLGKPAVSLMSSAAALLGFAAQADRIPSRALLVAISVFLLSAGAAALNNYQDRHADGLMERTRRRPLPSGRIEPLQALIQSAVLASLGTAGLLLWSDSMSAPLAGLTALFLYNALYTPLKKRTVLALVPGVLCGMLPPMVGWLAAGGDSVSPKIVYIIALFGVWQIPHLWLILLSHGADYRPPAPPTMLDALSTAQLRRVVLPWIAVFAFMTLFLRLFDIINNGIVVAIVCANALALPAVFLFALRKSSGEGALRNLFRYLNASTLMIIILAVLDSMIG